MNTKALIQSYTETRAREARGSAERGPMEWRYRVSLPAGRAWTDRENANLAYFREQDANTATLLTALKKIAAGQDDLLVAVSIARKAIAEVQS